MQYQVDHDLHIHSYISPCLGHDARQTPEAILAYGLTNSFRLVCVTDHIADKKVETSCWNWSRDSLDLEKGRTLLRFRRVISVDFSLAWKLIWITAEIYA